MPQVLGSVGGEEELSVDLSPSQAVPEMTCLAFGAAGVLENWLFMFGAKTVIQHSALGLQGWLEDKGNGRGVSPQFPFHSVPEQGLKNPCHTPRPEQGWADSPN